MDMVCSRLKNHHASFGELEQHPTEQESLVNSFVFPEAVEFHLKRKPSKMSALWSWPHPFAQCFE